MTEGDARSWTRPARGDKDAFSVGSSPRRCLRGLGLALNLPIPIIQARCTRFAPAGKGNPRHPDFHRVCARSVGATTAMTRENTPLIAADLSTFAKTLRAQLATRLERGAGLPGHVEMLNLLARAAGHRNVQALKAQVAATTPGQGQGQPFGPSAGQPFAPPAGVARSAPASYRWHGPKDPTLTPLADRTLRSFDVQGRLTRWPGRRPEQELALWGLWLCFDAKRRYSEREVNQILDAQHAFGDYCLLRRELVGLKLLTRTVGGAEYRKLAARPSDEIVALLTALRSRKAA